MFCEVAKGTNSVHSFFRRVVIAEAIDLLSYFYAAGRNSAVGEFSRCQNVRHFDFSFSIKRLTSKKQENGEAED